MGSKGYNGSFGYTGSAITGFTGSASTVIGFTGSQGTGFTGSASTIIGYTGSIGIGYTGSQSTVIGYTGSTGIGYTGSQSTVIGYTGSAGYLGSVGYLGSKGYNGSTGFTGSQSTVIGYTGSQSTVIGYTGSGGIGYTGSQSTIAGYTGSGGSGYTGSIGYTGSFLIITSTNTIPTTGWVSNTGDYAYKLDMAISGILSTDLVEVSIDKDSLDDAFSTQLCSTVESFTSGITFYAKTIPTVAMPFTWTVQATGLSAIVGYVGSKGYTGSIGIGYTGSLGYTGSQSTVIGYTGSNSTVIGYSGSRGLAATYTGSTAPADTSLIWIDLSTNVSNGMALRMLSDDLNPTLGGELNTNSKTIGGIETSNGNSGTSKTIDWRLGNHQSITMTGNCTFTFIAPTRACALSLRIINDATAGRTKIFPTMKFSNGTPLIWSTDANAIDILNLYYDGSTYYGMNTINFV